MLNSNTVPSPIGKGRCRDYMELPAGSVIHARASEHSISNLNVRYSPDTRGALMISISIKHPDAEKFVDKKMVEGAVTGANISVKITDDFMNAYNSGCDFYQTFPIEYSIGEIRKNGGLIDLEYDKLYRGNDINGSRTYFKKIDPRKLLDKLVYNAWSSAEPGALFWDKILSESPAKGYGKNFKEVSTNPCAELPLPPFDSCRLLVINLFSYIFNAFGDNAMLEDTLLIDHVKKAQRLMDDIVDLEIEKIIRIIESIKSKKYPKRFQRVELELWEKIMEKAVLGRRTGLGITAEGDLMAALGYKYGTPEASLFAEKLHQLIATASYESSIELAKERGHFPIWDRGKDEESEFLQRMFGTNNELITDEIFNDYQKYGRRNIANLTIAPTGSVSILTQTTSGIEPLFSAYYFRKKKVTNEDYHDYIDEMGDKWVEFPVFHRPFIQWFGKMNDLNMEESEDTLSKLDKNEINKLFIVSPYFQATAQDVDYIEKVRMQGGVQKWVDHSISVTVNMPEDVTVETVADVYKTAHKVGCKGITVYRDNSRGNVLSTTSIKDDTTGVDFNYVNGVKRPKSVECDVFFKSALKNPYIIFVGKVSNKPYELFAIPFNETTKVSKKVKTGTLVKNGKGKYKFTSKCGKYTVDNLLDHMIENEQNTTRLISGMLRHRADPLFVSETVFKFATINSFHKVVGRVLSSYVEGNNVCPECNGEMNMSDGCKSCPHCGYAQCG